MTMFDGAQVREEEGEAPPTAPRVLFDTRGTPAEERSLILQHPATERTLPSGRYGEGRSVNLPAILIAVAIHVIAITAVLLVRYEAPLKQPEKRLVTVNLMPPPPPPAKETPPPAKPDIVAPRPPIQLARAPLPVVPPDPVPREPSPVAAPSPAPTPPAVTVAGPPSVVQVSKLSLNMLSGTPPRYPVESRRKHEEGTIVLSLTLGQDGRVANISVSRSSGFDRLDQAALSAVRKWRWAPLVRDGKPVMVKGIVEIPFVLVN